MMARTLLIGLDGATFTVLDPLMREGTMPFLRSFLDAGVRSELLSTPNPLTPPAFTSMMTGRSPGYHGVYDFIRAEERDGLLFFTLVNARDVRCETIWSIASRSGRSVTCLNFIAMYPPQPVKGYIVPGFVTSRNLKMNVYPRDLYQRLKGLTGFDVKDVSWDIDQGRKPLLQGLAEHDYEAGIQYQIRKERQWFEIAHHLMRTDPCDLTAVVFDGVDKLQHLVWRFLDPRCFPARPTPGELRVRDLCREYFRQLDRYLAALVEAAGPDARVFMASDHGFGPTDEIFYVNAWLRDHGYLRWREGTPVEDSDSLTAQHLRSHYEAIDWDRTTAYARTSSSNGIYIRVADGPGKSGIPPSAYGAVRAKLIDELRGYRDPSARGPVVAQVLTREEAYPGPCMKQAPDLTLVLRDGGFVSIINAPDWLRPRAEVTGTHRPEGVLFAAGHGIRRGLSLSPRSILDVAPTLLYSLGLAVPADLEGRVLEDVFDPAVLRDETVEVGAPTLPAVQAMRLEERGEMTEGEEAQVIERLKGLGYL
jgi:predicted AlkP superfamily phosphohydrolase/phosphomutase